METIIINNEEYTKNVELIKAFGLINEWCLINRFEFHIQTITDIKMVLSVKAREYKEQLDGMLKTHENINYMSCEEYRDYEQTAETWSTLWLDINRVLMS